MSTIFSLSMEMSRLTRDGTAEAVSREQILRRERGQGSIHFPCSADHEQDWQSDPVDPYSCYMCDHTIHIQYYVGISMKSCILGRVHSLKSRKYNRESLQSSSSLASIDHRLYIL